MGDWTSTLWMNVSFINIINILIELVVIQEIILMEVPFLISWFAQSLQLREETDRQRGKNRISFYSWTFNLHRFLFCLQTCNFFFSQRYLILFTSLITLIIFLWQPLLYLTLIYLIHNLSRVSFFSYSCFVCAYLFGRWVFCIL